MKSIFDIVNHFNNKRLSFQNMQTTIQIKKLSNFCAPRLPCYATEQSAGMDLISSSPYDIVLHPGESVLVPTGIAIALPVGYEAQVRSKSGMALYFNVVVMNSPGTIDADYRGEIKVILFNHGKKNYIIRNGDHVAQMVIAKYEKATWDLVENLSETQRGENGFGSTGK